MRPVVRFTDVHDGSFALSEPDAALLARRARQSADRPVTWLRQVHGATVVRVDEPDVAQRAGEQRARGGCGVQTVPGLVSHVFRMPDLPARPVPPPEAPAAAGRLGWFFGLFRRGGDGLLGRF